MAFSFGLVRAVASEIPELDPAAQRTEVDGVVYASNGESVLTVLRGDESRVLLKKIDDVSPIMRQAIVAVEDRRFYEHNGVDVARHRARALAGHPVQGVVEGGSTITQQFVKNAYVRNERTLAREGAGGSPRLAARAALVEGSDPPRLPQHDLLRQRRLRHPAGSAHVLQEAREEADAARGRPPGRHSRPTRRCTTRRSIRVPPSSAATSSCGRCSTRARSPAPAARPQRTRRSRSAEDIRLPGTQGPAQYFVNYVKDQLVAKYGAGGSSAAGSR